MSYSLDILYEDNHLLVVNKKSGDLVQGDRTGDITLADQCKRYIKDKYKKPGDVFLGIVHRLDRPVSGVVIFARTSKALERMNKLFREKDVEKTYLAISHKRPEQLGDHLIHWLRKDSKTNKTKAFAREQNNTLKSELTYRVLATIGSHTLFEVNPLTGRPHQIRVQLAAIGCPIKGDLKYGAKKPNRDASIHLHAKSLNFIHPVKKENMKIFAPLPPDPTWAEFKDI